MKMNPLLDYTKGAAPLYAQIEDIFKRRIENGEYKKGEVIPGEKEIMEQFGVSRVTARQAMSALSNSGYIKSMRGIGTEVVYDKINENMKGVISLTEEMRQNNVELQTTFCTMEKRKAFKNVADNLGIAEGEECYCLTRVRSVQNSPLVYTKTYLRNVADLSMEEEQYKESLYQYLYDKHGIQITQGTDTLEAILPEEEVCEMLEISDRMPVFKRTRRTYIRRNGKEEKLEYSICYYPGNRYQYTVNL